MADSLLPHGLYSPWNCPGQNTGLGSLSLLQGSHQRVLSRVLFLFFLIIYFNFLALLSLCCSLAFSNCDERGYSLVVVHGSPIAVASFVVNPGLQGTWVSVAVVHGLCCPKACRIFPEQGLNPHPLHWQVDSRLLDHQGNPNRPFYAIQQVLINYLFYMQQCIYVYIHNLFYPPHYDTLVTIRRFSMSLILFLVCRLVHLYPFLDSAKK